jgi:ATP-binding cassette subfamily C protein CydC
VSIGPATIRQLIDEQPARRRGLVRPATMTALAFLLGAGLFGLAGWFIAASAVAGLAVASTFSFLFPSAGVQALAWARTLGRYGERITTHRATLDLVASLRTSLFARALRLPRERVAELRTSELLSRITVDSDAVENLLLRSSFPILAAIAALIATTVFFAIVSPELAIVAAAGLILTAGILIGLARHQAGPPARGLIASRAKARRALIETIDGLPELWSFGAERRACGEVTTQLDEFAGSRRRLSRLAARGQSVGTLFGDVTLLAVLAVAAGLSGTRMLPAPTFVAACLVTIAAFEPVGALPGAVASLARARAAGARLAELFPGNEVPAARLNVVPLERWPIGIAFEDANLELSLRSGELMLLTGASGSGKSTILRAIAGQPTPGIDVRVGGIQAASIDPGTLAQRVTLVAQDSYVFDGTIGENLQLADPAASEHEMWAALAAAALEDTVAAFPAGLEAPVGPGGSALSGGQRRRLSVAQGLLRHADALLLDEPTEGLDSHNASRLLAGVRRFDPGAAVVIALHDRQAPTLPGRPTAHVELVRVSASTTLTAVTETSPSRCVASLPAQANVRGLEAPAPAGSSERRTG